MSRRGFTYAELEASREAWEAFYRDGLHASEVPAARARWRDARHTMALRGHIDPPHGSGRDSWGDDGQLTQRAVIVRAMRDTPALFSRSLSAASSWGDLCRLLIAGRVGLEVDALERETWADQDAEPDRVGHAEAVATLAGVLRRISWSDPQA